MNVVICPVHWFHTRRRWYSIHANWITLSTPCGWELHFIGTVEEVLMGSRVYLILPLFLVAVSKATDLQPQSRLYSQIAVSALWPFLPPHFFTRFCCQSKLQWSLPAKGTMSLIAARDPLSWFVMIVLLDWSTIKCVFLMNFQKLVQMSLSLLPNNMANLSADMLPFAVFAYTE